MKKGFFETNYLKCWKFLGECRWHIVFALATFALLFVIGFIFPIFFREEIFDFIAKITAMIEGKTVLELVGMIFFNNLRASFFAMVLGIGFGIFPLMVGIVNGYLLGFVAREVVARGGILIMWRLFPHGIFELPAILFSIGVGLKIGTDLFRKNNNLKYNFKEGLRFFVFVIFPLLLVAGIVEGILIGLIG
ncbi:stage II sporulation protein M [Candidatus Pacearchaeota archaeon]|nr:stage II sporulation protein M [Candidatus Pacearchaeota archaeon]